MANMTRDLHTPEPAVIQEEDQVFADLAESRRHYARVWEEFSDFSNMTEEPDIIQPYVTTTTTTSRYNMHEREDNTSSMEMVRAWDPEQLSEQQAEELTTSRENMPTVISI
jgi:hypothetical protein